MSKTIVDTPPPDSGNASDMRPGVGSVSQGAQVGGGGAMRPGHWSPLTGGHWPLTGLSRARSLAREQWLQIVESREQEWRSAVTTNGDTVFSSGWTEL